MFETCTLYNDCFISEDNANKELLVDILVLLPACWKSSERIESVGGTVISKPVDWRFYTKLSVMTNRYTGGWRRM
jgi:hypothetical protein